MTSSIRFPLSFGLILLLLLSGAFAGAQEPKPSPGTVLQKTAEEAVSVRQQSQKLADQWAVETADLRSEMEALEAELETLNWRREKIAVYIKDLEGKMAALEKQEQSAAEIRNELEPFLDQALEELRDFSEKDLPMLAQLQAPALRATMTTLNNADANMVHKTRRLLETTTQALEYGYFPQVDESEIDIQGRRIRVQRLCVGRLGLFALSSDGRDAWKWEKDTGRYEPISHFARSIQEVIQMTQRTRLVSLVKLPVGPPQEPVPEETN